MRACASLGCRSSQLTPWEIDSLIQQKSRNSSYDGIGCAMQNRPAFSASISRLLLFDRFAGSLKSCGSKTASQASSALGMYSKDHAETSRRNSADDAIDAGVAS